MMHYNWEVLIRYCIRLMNDTVEYAWFSITHMSNFHAIVSILDENGGKDVVVIMRNDNIFGRSEYMREVQKITEELSRHAEELYKKGKGNNMGITVNSAQEFFKEIHVSFGPIPEIERVIYNAPATIVLWKDGTKTVVKADEYEIYDPEKGLAMCISKKALGNKGNYYDTFKKHLANRNVVLASPNGVTNHIKDENLRKLCEEFKSKYKYLASCAKFYGGTGDCHKKFAKLDEVKPEKIDISDIDPDQLFELVIKYVEEAKNNMDDWLPKVWEEVRKEFEPIKDDLVGLLDEFSEEELEKIVKVLDKATQLIHKATDDYLKDLGTKA